MNELPEDRLGTGDRQEALMRRFIDPLVHGRLDSRVAWALLSAGMLVSLFYCLWVTRGTTFSGDELTWVAFSPTMDFSQALEPHSGHLVLIPHLLYHAVLENIGTDYLTFRLLTLVSVFLATGLFFAYARKRVGDFVALAPCLVLLFFGSDSGHILQGNGFTIMFAVSCGMAALLGLERKTLAGNLIACVALVLGVLTYTTALPFLVGAIAVVLFGEDRWKRLWVVAVPVGVYLAWRVWLVTGDVDTTRGELDPVNIFLLPAWIFQSLSGILSALTGFNYNFGGGGWLPPGEMAGPSLALIFIALIGWRMSKVRLGSWFWVAMIIALALFASQVLTFIPAVREPGTSRYLYPGAFAVLLILLEAFRAYPMNRTRFIVIWLIAICGFCTNAIFIKGSGNTLRDRGNEVAAEVTASTLVSSAFPYLPGASSQSVVDLVSDAPTAIISGAEEKYGGIGLSEEELLTQPPELRAKADSIMAGAFGLGLTVYEAKRPPVCEQVEAPAGGTITDLELPPNGVVLESSTAGNVFLKRFDPEYSTAVGTLVPDQLMNLYVPADDGSTPWQLMTDVPSLTICEPG